MSYSTLNSSDDLQRKCEQMERKWHFIGRAFVCHKGGFEHEHLSKENCLSCTGEDIRTKQKQEHARYLKDQDLKIAVEKTKRVEIAQTEQTKRVEKVEETKREEMRLNRERQRAEEHLNKIRIQNDYDIEMQRLETDSANNMEKSRLEELVNSVCELLISINKRNHNDQQNFDN